MYFDSATPEYLEAISHYSCSSPHPQEQETPSLSLSEIREMPKEEEDDWNYYRGC